MTENDEEHIAFEKFAKKAGLDLTMHPLHLLYLDPITANALDAFKAGRLSLLRKLHKNIVGQSDE